MALPLDLHLARAWDSKASLESLLLEDSICAFACSETVPLTLQLSIDMYGNTAEDFQMRMKPFIQNTPLQAARPGIDDEKYIKDVERAGGRPGYDHEIAGMYIYNSLLLLSFGNPPYIIYLDSTTLSGAAPHIAYRQLIC